MKKGQIMIVSVLVVLAVIAGLVYITINKKSNSILTDQKVGVDQNANMQNTPDVNETKIPDGIKITILKEGAGQVAKTGDIVAMNYTGTLTNGKVFDSNVDPKFQHVQPFVFTIGANQVIKGWDIGVAGMKIGEKRKLELSSDFAYGSTGAGNIIPPNASLIFEVELLGIKK
jgi:FKBP-type peptidyl-prolyl cis-trans isomerase